MEAQLIGLSSDVATSRPPTFLRRLAAHLLLILFGVFLSLASLEIALRIYNPFGWRLRGDKIILPTDEIKVVNNPNPLPYMDATIVQTRNSIGFRGPNPPQDLPNWLSLVTVGGSTTECFYLSDNKTWPARLSVLLDGSFSKVWVNNAGFDGQSTYGHQLMIKDYLSSLRPKVALFLFGINDIGLAKENSYDQYFTDHLDFWKTLATNREATLRLPQLVPTFSEKLAASFYSFELPSTILNLTRVWRAKKNGFDHQTFDIRQSKPLETSDAEIQTKVAEHRHDFIPSFQSRVRSLIALSRANGIEPVFVTQPFFLGQGIDPTTGMRLDLPVWRANMNGKTWWTILETYNDVTRSIAAEGDVHVIDLARLLPKDSRFFYDVMHFNTLGAETAAGLIAKGLIPFLAERFPSFRR